MRATLQSKADDTSLADKVMFACFGPYRTEWTPACRDEYIYTAQPDTQLQDRRVRIDLGKLQVIFYSGQTCTRRYFDFVFQNS